MPDSSKVIPINIEDEVENSYLNYAMSVIVSRALPDVRDGLKPVHRRIIYSMHEMGLRSDRPFKKAGRIVGDVLGKFHPHGDQSIYDALVRLAQEFSLRYPVVRGQGNFGSVDGDPPAAMRYTEAKMSRLAEEMIRDIEKNTVVFGPNYDDSMEEPTVLPTTFPFLLANGSSGIAVGMATNMAPHNLTEICNAIVAQIKNPEISIDELMEYIKGPDFPTAGIIYGRAGIISAFKSGRGQIIVRSRYNIEESKTGKETIIVTELPYQVNKAQLVEHIAQLVREKKLDGISDLRDESDRTGMRILIEIKKGFDSDVILNFLFTHTSLQQAFNVNNLALVSGRPKVLNLKEMLTAFIEHRFDVITKRTIFDLDAAEKRAHILIGLKLALDNIDEVIEIIKKSRSVSDAKDRLISRFSFSEIQAQAILDLRLQKLTSLETQKIIDELNEVLALIDFYKDLLAHPAKIYGIIENETTELSNKFGDKRRTEINQTELVEVDLEDLIQEEEVVVLQSIEGYIKRVNLSAFKAQSRGGKGSNSANLKDEDIVDKIFVCSTHDYVLFISSLGKAFWVKAYQLPEGTRISRGKHINNILELSSGETIKTALSIKQFSEEEFVLMGTKKGQLIRISTWNFRNAKAKGINGISLKEGDSIVSASVTNGNSEIFLVTKNGFGLKFNEKEVRDTNRNSSGVRGIRLRNSEDELVGAYQIISDEALLIFSEKGFGKRLAFDSLSAHSRGTMGQICYKCNEKTGKILDAVTVSPEYDLVCITSLGKTIKCNTEDVSLQGPYSMGVKIISVDSPDFAVGLARALKEDLGGES